MVLTQDEDVRRSHSRDASGLQMIPDSVARASCAADVVEVVRNAVATGNPVTPAGSQTSMTGASITDRGTLLSLSAMKRIVDIDPALGMACVEPGLTIGDLNRALAETGLHFAPDPTSENDATIGGAIACNASGARTLRYGPTRAHVAALEVVHSDGVKSRYARPGLEKNTVGYAMGQDPVDWFIGSEGTLGIVVEAEVRLTALPLQPVGLAIPFETTGAALAFVVSARQQLDDRIGRQPRCLEYFDHHALAIAGQASSRPWTDGRAMIYLEDDAGEGSIDDMLDDWLALAERHEALAGDIRVYNGVQPLREARAMRHSVPAAMNERGDKFRSAGGRKVSTDWAVPYRRLGDALVASAEACREFGVPEPVTYGHAGNGHPHQNFIAEDEEDLRRIYHAVERTLKRVIELGGTVSAEHGLGKVKRDWLKLQVPPRQVDAMRALKQSLDPRGLLSPGNIL